jgi:hypothetical protein
LTRQVRETVLEVFKSFESSFQPNELATLLLTGKDENLFRDRFCLRLSQAFVNQGIVVAREWRHTDIAIFRKRELGSSPANALPSVLIEFKSMYTFDPLKDTIGLKNPLEYRTRIRDDLVKCSSLSIATTLAYAFLMATNPLSQVKTEYWPIVNLANRINETIRVQRSPENIRMRCSNIVKKWFPGKAEEITLQGGEYLDVPVEVICWLIGPYKKDEAVEQVP